MHIAIYTAAVECHNHVAMNMGTNSQSSFLFHSTQLLHTHIYTSCTHIYIITITVVHMHALNKSALRLMSHDSFDLHVKAIVINFISPLFPLYQRTLCTLL